MQQITGSWRHVINIKRSRRRHLLYFISFHTLKLNNAQKFTCFRLKSDEKIETKKHNQFNFYDISYNNIQQLVKYKVTH